MFLIAIVRFAGCISNMLLQHQSKTRRDFDRKTTVFYRRHSHCQSCFSQLV